MEKVLAKIITLFVKIKMSFIVTTITSKSRIIVSVHLSTFCFSRLNLIHVQRKLPGTSMLCPRSVASVKFKGKSVVRASLRRKRKNVDSGNMNSKKLAYNNIFFN